MVFLHAYANPAHEAAVALRLRQRLPGVAVTASHEVSRNWREYERSNTAVLSAYVQPIMAGYLANLDRALSAEGLSGQRYCMQSNGGLAKFAAAEAGPLALVESGPAGGVAGAVRIGQALGESDILYLDVGGTTAKCSLIRDGQPVLKSEYKLEWTRLLPGYPVQVPVVDIVEIGAGGGSIAHIGPAGELRVGPESAGADPGPACYGRGGAKPTVTDAKLLTGAIDPDRFAGGRMRLDREFAAKAFEPIAQHLKTSVVGAAEAVIRLAEANMINALKLVTIQRGHDPRDLTMVVSGGGGPMHAATLGRELGVRRTVIPRHVGLFSAWGMLTARPRVDLRQTSFSTLTAETPAMARALFRRLEEEAEAYFGTGSSTPLVFDRQIEMRYVGQEHTVATPFDPDGGVEALREAFHAKHEQTYTFRLPDTDVELVTYHLGAELDTPRVDLPEIDAAGTVESALIGDLEVHLGGNGGGRRANVYDRDRLPSGTVLDGPVLIEEPTATTLVLAGQRATVDRFGLVVIEEAP